MQRKSTTDAPTGLCFCGCGRKTPLAKRNYNAAGLRKGEPIRFCHGHGKMPVAERWREEDRGYATPCHIWQLAKDGRGYGIEYTRRGGHMRAHRRRYLDAHGHIPDGTELDHLCRQSDCVNPEHLEPVTRTENVRRGNGSKLTIEIARDIRSRVEAGQTKYSVAKHFQVGYTTVCNIVKEITWKEG